MSKKNKPDTQGYVYSTDPNFRFEEEAQYAPETLPPAEQKLKIRLETKHRAGKTVTLVDGFVGTEADAEQLGKALKNFCGTGGSVKDGEIIVQGDQRDKVMQFMQKNGYVKAKKI
ncbi:MAG: translation initiation factor [Dinghuibacter sp.]|nr:translation initiation factor [Dinghuibacter sp.]